MISDETSALYFVSWRTIESYAPRLFRGPRQDDWRSFCLSLMPRARDLAIKHAKEVDSVPPSVGPGDLLDALCEILIVEGYERILIEEFDLWLPYLINRPRLYQEEAATQFMVPGLSEDFWEPIFRHNEYRLKE